MLSDAEGTCRKHGGNLFNPMKDYDFYLQTALNLERYDLFCLKNSLINKIEDL